MGGDLSHARAGGRVGRGGRPRQASHDERFHVGGVGIGPDCPGTLRARQEIAELRRQVEPFPGGRGVHVESGPGEGFGHAAARGDISSAAVTPQLIELAPALVDHYFLMHGAPVPDEVLTGIVDNVLLPLLAATTT